MVLTSRDSPHPGSRRPQGASGGCGRCALSFDNLTVVPKAYFVDRICELTPVRLAEVCIAMRVAFGC